jgi:acetyltransferase-like isoleucine patch superfamily enzyme
LISSHAVVETDRIGQGVRIGEFAVVRGGAVLGNNVVVHPHVVIEPGVRIGDDVEIFPGTYIGKEPKGPGVLARQPEFSRYVIVGRGSSIGPHAVIYYDVEIGEDTLVGDGASIREKCRIGSRCIISRYVTINYNTTVGDRTKVMDLTHLTGNMRIGSDVFVSVLVGSVNDNAIGALPYDEGRVRGPVVEDGAAVGSGAVLLPAVTIGAGSIVGAGSVVTKDVPLGTLVIGSPARGIRTIAAEEEG